MNTTKKSRAGRYKRDVTVTRLRSAITNGTALLADCDHRTAWMRRLRDLISAHTSDMGGLDNISEAERSILRRASMLELQLEMLETRFAANPDGVASTSDLLLYQRTASALRRLLESLGLQRRAKDVTPHPLDYARDYDRRRAQEIEEVV
jgi:hypothetical protein